MAQPSLQGVGKTFCGRTGAWEAVREVSLDITDGEFLSLLGTSGCGKTTVLNMVAGFAALTAGRISLDGREVARPGVARFLRQDRGLVAELISEVGYRMDLTADAVANVQLATNQLRGIGRLAKEVTPAQVIWPDALRAAAPDRVKI